MRAGIGLGCRHSPADQDFLPGSRNQEWKCRHIAVIGQEHPASQGGPSLDTRGDDLPWWMEVPEGEVANAKTSGNRQVLRSAHAFETPATSMLSLLLARPAAEAMAGPLGGT